MPDATIGKRLLKAAEHYICAHSQNIAQLKAGMRPARSDWPLAYSERRLVYWTFVKLTGDEAAALKALKAYDRENP